MSGLTFHVREHFYTYMSQAHSPPECQGSTSLSTCQGSTFLSTCQGSTSLPACHGSISVSTCLPCQHVKDPLPYPHVRNPLPYPNVRDRLPYPHVRNPPIHMSGIPFPARQTGATSTPVYQNVLQASSLSPGTLPCTFQEVTLLQLYRLRRTVNHQLPIYEFTFSYTLLSPSPFL